MYVCVCVCVLLGCKYMNKMMIKILSYPCPKDFSHGLLCGLNQFLILIIYYVYNIIYIYICMYIYVCVEG